MISTAHLSDRTLHYLSTTSCVEWPVVGGHYRERGFMFHADETLAYGVDEEYELPDLADICRYACDLGIFHILCYDLGEVVEGLALYRDPHAEELFFSGASKI